MKRDESSSIIDLIRTIENEISSPDFDKTTENSKLAVIIALGKLLEDIVSSKMADFYKNQTDAQSKFYAEKIVKSAEELLSNSIKIIINIGSMGDTDFETFYDAMNAATKSAFTATVNLLDFKDPSWPIFKSDYLSLGLGVIIGNEYAAYGYDSFGGKEIEEIKLFPKILNRR